MTPLLTARRLLALFVVVTAALGFVTYNSQQTNTDFQRQLCEGLGAQNEALNLLAQRALTNAVATPEQNRATADAYRSLQVRLKACP